MTDKTNNTNLELNKQFAYDQGWMDASSGTPLDNPYPEGSPEAESYLEGYNEAKN